MKKLLPFLLLLFFLPGCVSKHAVQQPDAPYHDIEKQLKVNCQLPVRLQVNQPMSISLSGTATVVRDQYIYMSFRLFGFEVAQAYLNSTEADFVLKQPQKLWVQEPVEGRLAEHGYTVGSLQDTIFSKDEFSLKTKVRGIAVDATLTWDMDQAHWNIENPAKFSEPSGCRKMNLQEAIDSLGR